MLALCILLPLVLTGGRCAAVDGIDKGPDNATVPDPSPGPGSTAGDVGGSRTASARFSVALPASPEYNVSGSEPGWATDLVGEPVAEIILVRHGASDFATETDVTESINEEANVNRNPNWLLAYLKKKARAAAMLQDGKSNGTAAAARADDMRSQATAVSLSAQAADGTSEAPGQDVALAAAVPARTEATQDCAGKARRRSQRRRSGAERQVLPLPRMPTRKAASRKSGRSALRKVKVVLSRGMRTVRTSRGNRTSPTSTPPSPLLPPPLVSRTPWADGDTLTLRERGCLPLETSPAVPDRSTCPFRFITSFDRRRLPRLLTSVRCMCPGSPCNARRGYRCLEISKPVSLMRRVGRMYVDQLEEMPVACVCAYVGPRVRGRSP
ncbi:uncharacterized protein LOC144112067 [Amblyomma americanum]